MQKNSSDEKNWRPNENPTHPPTAPYDPSEPDETPDRVQLPPDVQPQPPVPGREPDAPNPLGPNDGPAGDPPSNHPKQLALE